MTEGALAGVQWLASADNGPRLGRVAEQSVIEWSDIGHLTIAETEATFFPRPGVDHGLLAKFVATDLLACRRYLSGLLSIHASAVAWPSGGIALVGESGAGKSTTAMALVERGGAAFLADDIVPLDIVGNSQALIQPVEDAFWLGEDSRVAFGIADPSTKSKRACAPRARAREAAPLRCIVQLVFDNGADKPELSRLSGQDTFVVLSRSQVSFSFGDVDAVVRDLEIRARLAACVPLLSLRRRRSFDALPVVTELLLECGMGKWATEAGK